MARRRRIVSWTVAPFFKGQTPWVNLTTWKPLQVAVNQISPVSFLNTGIEATQSVVPHTPVRP